MKKSLFLGKQVAKGMVVLQLMSLFAGIGAVRADASTTEVTLLASVIALRGAGLSQSITQQQLKAAVQNYQENAPIDGREDRLQQALVQLNIMTDGQASTFRSSIDSNVEEKVGENTNLSQQETDTLMAQSVQSALSGLQGAQFSACDNAEIGTDFLIAGAGITTIVSWVDYGSEHDEQKSVTTSKTTAFIGLGVLTAAIIARVYEGYNCN